MKVELLLSSIGLLLLSCILSSFSAVGAQPDDCFYEYADLFEYDAPVYDSDILFQQNSPSEGIELYENNGLKYWVKEYQGNYYAQLTNVGIVTEGQEIIVPESIDYLGNICRVVSVGIIFQPFDATQYVRDEYMGHVGFTDNYNSQSAPTCPGGLGGLGFRSVFTESPVHYSLVFTGCVVVKDHAFNEFNLFEGLNNAFCYYTQCGLTSVTFSGGVYSIGNWAFAYSCLDTIFIPQTTQHVGDHAFYCSTLKNVIWDTDADIPDYAFASTDLFEYKGDIYKTEKYFEKLTSITINGAIEQVGEGAFFDTNLVSIDIPDSVLHIGDRACSHCYQLNSVTLGKGIDIIPVGCFNMCSSLANIVVGGSITEVGGSAFHDCTQLNTFDFSAVETIGSYAFHGAFCGDEVTLLDLSKAKYIGERAFKNCTSPVDLRLSSELTYVGKEAFNGFGAIINPDISIPDGCILEQGAFSGSLVESVTFGDRCTIASNSFRYCTNLKSIAFGQDCILEDSTYGNTIFGGSGLKSVTIPSTLYVGRYAFNKSESLESVVFEGSRETIGNWFQDCSNLTELTLPQDFKTFSGSPFYGCSKFDISKIPLNCSEEEVLSWNIGAFEGTRSIIVLPLFEDGLEGTISFLNVTLMKDGVPTKLCFMIDISGATNSMQLEEPYAYSYRMPDNLAGIYNSVMNKPLPLFEFPNNLYQVYDYAIYDRTGTTLIKVPYNTKGLLIMDHVTAIAPYACYKATMLEVANIPASITTIGEGAFAYSGLGKVQFENGLVTIGARAFLGTKLTSVVLPYTVEYVGDYAFSGVDVSIPTNSLLNYVGDQGLDVVEGGSVFIPAGLNAVGDIPFGYKLSAAYLGAEPSNYPAEMMRSSKITMSTSTGGMGVKIAAHPVGVNYYLPIGMDKSAISFEMLFGCEGGSFGGYYVSSANNLIVVGDAVETSLGTVYIYSSIGAISGNIGVSETDGQVEITLSLSNGWTQYDVESSISCGTVMMKDSNVPYSLIFVISDFQDGAVLTIGERVVSQTVTIAFDSVGGNACSPIHMGKGRTLSAYYPIPEKNCSEFMVWKDSDGNEYWPYTPIMTDVTLYAVWQDANPRIIFNDHSHMSVEVNGVSVDSGCRVAQNDLVTIRWISTEGHTFSHWILSSDGVQETKYSSECSFSIINDTVVDLYEEYYNPSDKLRNVYSVEFPTDIDILYLQWSTAYVQETTGMLWTGGTSVPLVVNDRLYSRGGDYLYMYDLDTGRILKKVPSVAFKGYYHYVGYANGMIFDYTSKKVYDLDLNYLMDMPYRASKMLWDDTGIYMIGGSGIFKYSLDLSSLIWSFDDNSRYKSYTNYGTPGEVQIYDGYLYWVGLNASKEIFLQSVDIDTGMDFHEHAFPEYQKYMLDDGWVTCYDGTVYLTVYSTGLFGDNFGGVSGGIIAIPVNHGVFAEEYKFYETNGKANSQFIVHNGRGYLNAGVMFYVFDVNGAELTEVYKYNHGYFTHGGIVLNDVPDSNTVEVFFIPYDPTCTVFVFYDSPGQTLPLYRAITVEVIGQYNTQGVRFTDDGRLYFYNDTGNLFMLSPENTGTCFFIIMNEGIINCMECRGMFEDAAAGLDITKYEYVYMFSKGGSSLPLDFDESLTDRYFVYLFSDVPLKNDDIFETRWFSDEFGSMTISDMRGGRLYLDGAEFYPEKDEYLYHIRYVDSSGNTLKEDFVGTAPAGTTFYLPELVDTTLSGYSFRNASADVFKISCDESKNTLVLTYGIIGQIVVDLRDIATEGSAPIEDLQTLAEGDDSVTLLLPAGSIELDNSCIKQMAESFTSVSVGLEVIEPSTLTEDQRNAVPNGALVISVFIESSEGPIHDLGGKAIITVPIDIPGDSFTVWYLDDYGSMQKVDEVTASDGSVSFTTTHFSYYVIGTTPSSDDADYTGLLILVAAIIVLSITIVCIKKRARE